MNRYSLSPRPSLFPEPSIGQIWKQRGNGAKMKITNISKGGGVISFIYLGTWDEAYAQAQLWSYSAIMDAFYFHE